MEQNLTEYETYIYYLTRRQKQWEKQKLIFHRETMENTNNESKIFVGHECPTNVQ